MKIKRKPFYVYGRRPSIFAENVIRFYDRERDQLPGDVQQNITFGTASIESGLIGSDQPATIHVSALENPAVGFLQSVSASSSVVNTTRNNRIKRTDQPIIARRFFPKQMITRQTSKLFRRFNIKQCFVSIQRNAELERAILVQPRPITERRYTVENGQLQQWQNNWAPEEDIEDPIQSFNDNENDEGVEEIAIDVDKAVMEDEPLLDEPSNEGEEAKQPQQHQLKNENANEAGYKGLASNYSSDDEETEHQAPNKPIFFRPIPNLVPIRKTPQNPETALLNFARAQAAKLEARDLTRGIKSKN